MGDGPRVLIWPADEGGTGWYRLRWPAMALAREGADVVIDTRGPVLAWSAPWQGAQPPPWVDAVALAQHPGADVVVLQRPGRKWWAQAIPMLQKIGVRVVVDVDDRFDKIDPRNAAYPHYAQPATAWHSWLHIDAACRLADLVTASTPALVERFGYGHGLVLPNLVPDLYLRLALMAEVAPCTVGWSGSVETHPGDLEATAGQVPLVLGAWPDWRVHVVGTGEGVADRLRLTGPQAERLTASGWVTIEDYPLEVARLAVGVVPLADSVFNRGKSALKMGEMAAMGVPVIASPTPDNQRLHGQGVGVLAASPGQWRRHLHRLAGSPQARADLGGAGRQAMARLTYEQHCGRWWDAWTAPLRQRVATVAPPGP